MKPAPIGRVDSGTSAAPDAIVARPEEVAATPKVSRARPSTAQQLLQEGADDPDRHRNRQPPQPLRPVGRGQGARDEDRPEDEHRPNPLGGRRVEQLRPPPGQDEGEQPEDEHGPGIPTAGADRHQAREDRP